MNFQRLIEYVIFNFKPINVGSEKFLENKGLCLRFTRIHGKSLIHFSRPRKRGNTVISDFRWGDRRLH